MSLKAICCSSLIENNTFVLLHDHNSLRAAVENEIRINSKQNEKCKDEIVKV